MKRGYFGDLWAPRGGGSSGATERGFANHDSHRDVWDEEKAAGIEVAAGIAADAFQCRG
jgi:hypothetical protein